MAALPAFFVCSQSLPLSMRIWQIFLCAFKSLYVQKCPNYMMVGVCTYMYTYKYGRVLTSVRTRIRTRMVGA